MPMTRSDRTRAAAKAAGIAALAALYVSSATIGNAAEEASCAAAAATAAKMVPLAKGEVAGVQVQDKPKLVPDLAFTAGDGTPRKLSDLRGKTVLLNLWATWCVPCRQEMPALDKLQATLGASDGATAFEVVAVNIDTRNPDKPKQFYADMKIGHLAFYADPSAKIYQDLKAIGKAFGMPTTMIIDSQGCEIAYLAGPAEWAGADALALVGAAVGKQP
ncbi:MAG: TlpA family protein disulfide reductase [Beijerinckiaceae bacterium]|nr:TlpA family protein disulfide reductase [Beijerinckiaceae bacterium]